MLLLVAALVLGGCAGGGTLSGEEVVRAWNDAVRAGDDERAAELFAPGAKIVQASYRVLETAGEAVEWNASLPCSAQLVALSTYSPGVVDATFRLMDRTLGSCRGLGERVTVVFTIRAGRIEVFHQLLDPPAYVRR